MILYKLFSVHNRNGRDNQKGGNYGVRKTI